MSRKPGTIILILFVFTIIGSGLSHLLSKFFPSGPVYKLICEIFPLGINNLTLNLGFLELVFGLKISISGLTILFIILGVIFLIRL